MRLSVAALAAVVLNTGADDPEVSEEGE